MTHEEYIQTLEQLDELREQIRAFVDLAEEMTEKIEQYEQEHAVEV